MDEYLSKNCPQNINYLLYTNFDSFIDTKLFNRMIL